MTVTQTLPEPPANVPDRPAPSGPPSAPYPPPYDPSPGPSRYPPYWLVRDWIGTQPDEMGRAIVERAIYVSPNASNADHAAAVSIINDALCRWAHPDDIRWCHLPDGGTGGYTIVGTAVRGVSVGEDCWPNEEDPTD